MALLIAQYNSLTVSVIKDTIITHLLKLSKRDKYLRFGYDIPDSAIEDFVHKTVKDVDTIWIIAHQTRTLILGIPKVVGVAQLHINRKTGIGEVAVSVNKNQQGNGIGTKLMEAVNRAARSRSIHTLYMLALKENKQIIHIAKKVGIDVESVDHEEVEGRKDVRWNVDDHHLDMFDRVVMLRTFIVDYQLDWLKCFLTGKC